MRLINDSITKNLYESLQESVMINTGSTNITSDETGVTIEDNGNVITSGNGVTINVDNEEDVLSTEMDVAEPTEELPTDEEPIEDLDIEPTEETPIEEPTEDEELPSEPVDDEDDLDESTVNEEVLEKKDEETEEEVNNSKVEECDKADKKKNEKIEEIADGYNQNQNVEIYQNPEFDYQILDITELDNTDTGDIRAIDMANILNDLDESLTEATGTNNWGEINSFLTRRGTHKKTNESYSSAILELTLPRLNESIGEYKNVFMLEVYGDGAIKECVVRNSKSQIIKEYCGKSKDPVKHFEGVIFDIMNSRKLNEEISQAAYSIADGIANEFKGKELITWDEFREKLEEFAQEYDPSLIDDEHLIDFETDVRNVLSIYYGLNTIYEGENEGGLTTKEPTNEAVEVMVNKSYKDSGMNFADGKVIDKDEERQEKHIKQHEDKNKEKKFEIGKEPDQENTTGKTEEELTDTAEVEALPKAKKTKVDAEKIKVKEIKESEDYDTYASSSIFEYYPSEEEALKDVERIKDNYEMEAIVPNGKEYALWVHTKGDTERKEQGKKESAKLNEAEDELLDEPIVTDGTEPEDELNESGSDVAIFHRKPASVDAMRAAEQNGITVNKSNYKIIGTKEMSSDEFNQFANHLSSGEYSWLEEYNDTSNSGEFKCVEVINTDDNSYSILVDPQGYNYARYAAIKDNTDEEELLEPEEELIDEPTEEHTKEVEENE